MLSAPQLCSKLPFTARTKECGCVCVWVWGVNDVCDVCPAVTHVQISPWTGRMSTYEHYTINGMRGINWLTRLACNRKVIWDKKMNIFIQDSCPHSCDSFRFKMFFVFFKWPPFIIPSVLPLWELNSLGNVCYLITFDNLTLTLALRDTNTAPSQMCCTLLKEASTFFKINNVLVLSTIWNWLVTQGMRHDWWFTRLQVVQGNNK